MSASAKVVLYTSKTLSNGEHPIMIRIIKDRKPAYISTGKSSPQKLWDFKNNLPKAKHPLKRELDILLPKKLSEANKTILNFENEEKYFSGEVVRSKLKKTFSRVSVFKYFETEIERLEKANRIGYADVFKNTKKALVNFRKGKDFLFVDVNVKFLTDLEIWFSERGVTGNSISVFMRTLRKLMNNAINEGYCPQEVYPFKSYNISKLHTQTSKRALTKEQMKEILEVEVQKDSRLFHSKNYFVFSYYCRGMNFSDMAFLKWSNINGKRISYVRVKTGVHYNMEILPPALEILNYYKEHYFQSQTGFVFPILNEFHVTARSMSYRIDKVLSQTNRHLKELAKLAGLDVHLTTYVARHSYATVLKRSGVSTSIISEGLGHTTEKTTQIYLDSFENETLDEANKALL